SFDLAVEAMRRGACDFIQKPWENERLLAAIRKQAESERRRKSELEIAANVQQKLFPRNSRLLKTVDYAGLCMAAREVGGDYDDRTRKLRYVNCAHVAPILLRASGEIDRLEPTATMLGAFPSWKCTEAAVEFAPRDMLVLYSDGVTEAGIEHGDDFGEARLIQ